MAGHNNAVAGSEATTANKDEQQYKGTNNSLMQAITDEVIQTSQKVIPIKVIEAGTSHNNYEDLLNQVLIDTSILLSPPPVILDIVSQSHNSPLATFGNFSLVIGKAKSRKTFFISLLVAACIGGKLLMDKLQAYLNAKTVLVFDTEQAAYDVQKVARRILATAELTTSPLLSVYCLRKYDTQTRRKIIEFAIYNTPNLGMVVIDGVRDLVCDINSPEEATSLATDLLKWTEEMNIHIVTVLHQNKGDNNARGHVGTELINKAESVLSIAKDSNNPELSIVTPEYFRGKEFLPFAFSVDLQGLPYIDNNWQGEAGKQKEAEAHNVDDSFHMNIIREAFRINTRPSYKEAWMQLKTAWMPFTRTGNNKAIGYLTYYVSKGWVRKIEKAESGKNWALYENTLPL